MKNIFKILTLASFLTLTYSCSESEHREKKTLAPISVEVETIEGGLSNKYVTASGKIEAKNSVNISTRMMGYITSIKVKTGQKVSKGQLLATINNTDLVAKKAQVEASILQAEAAYNSAKKDYDRFVILYNQKSATQKELDDITTHFEMAKAGLEAAKQMKNEVMAQFSYTNLTAPFSGTITGAYAKEGDMANPGMPILSMEGNTQLQAKVMVSESDISLIKKGLEAEVLVKSLDKKLQAKVIEVSSSALNTGGQYIVKLDLENADKTILSGMFINVVFPIEKNKNSLSEMVLLPTSAIVEYGQLQGVYAVTEDNIAILRWLRLGKNYGNEVEVLSGLAPGEKYVTSAQGKLFNGASVNF